MDAGLAQPDDSTTDLTTSNSLNFMGWRQVRRVRRVIRVFSAASASPSTVSEAHTGEKRPEITPGAPDDSTLGHGFHRLTGAGWSDGWCQARRVGAYNGPTEQFPLTAMNLRWSRQNYPA